MAQVMLSQTLTDILTAATMSGQDPAPWLLGSMMEECLTLARGFDTLVPEEFYLPAPPYYCPQPEYIPNVSPSHSIDNLVHMRGGGGGGGGVFREVGDVGWAASLLHVWKIDPQILGKEKK